MNSRVRKALSLPVDQLLSKTLAYDQIFGSDIKTIRDLIDHTWGAFSTSYPFHRQPHFLEKSI